MIYGETASWEDAQLDTIAKDYELLHIFQVLKYINGERLSILTDCAADLLNWRSVGLLVSTNPSPAFDSNFL